MGTEPKTVRYPDEIVSDIEAFTDENDEAESDVIRRATRIGLQELEREQSPISSALVTTSRYLMVGGFAVGVVGAVTRAPEVPYLGTVMLALAIGCMAYERKAYSGGV